MSNLVDNGHLIPIEAVKEDWADFALSNIFHKEYPEKRLQDIDTCEFAEWITSIIAWKQKHNADGWWAEHCLPNCTEDRLAYRAFGLWCGLDTPKGEHTSDLYAMMDYIDSANRIEFGDPPYKS